MTGEPYEPIPPGHGEPKPVSNPVDAIREDDPGWEAAATPECPRCYYKHGPGEPCPRDAKLT